MNNFPEGNAVVYCEGSFNTTNGKTAHGLVRRTARYDVLSVIDSRYHGQDAGEILDGKTKNIPAPKKPISWRQILNPVRLSLRGGQHPHHGIQQPIRLLVQRFIR